MLAGIVGFISYIGYESILAMTTTTPPTVPSFTGTDELYQSARQKLADFDHDVVNHQAATVRFSGDEVNALLSHNPDLSKDHIQTFVSFTDSEARIQAAFPTDGVSHGAITGRYSGFDFTFEIHLNQVTRSVEMVPRTLLVLDKPMLGPDAPNPQATESLVRAFTPTFDQRLNEKIRESSDGAALLDQAKSIEVQDGQLVLETR